MTARGGSFVDERTASATAQVPNVSAAGMDSAGRLSASARLRCAARSVADVDAAWSSACSAVPGHSSDTSQAVVAPLASVVNAYPPTPS
eukprot:6188832-Pleurochrysis_carterae.AAC.1